MSNAVFKYGDTTVNVHENTVNAPSVIQFLMETEKVKEQDSNPLDGMIEEVSVMGQETQWPREYGVGGFYQIDADSDRTPKFGSNEHRRIPIRYTGFDQDYNLKDEAGVDSQLSQASSFVRKIQASYQRLKFQNIYNMLHYVANRTHYPPGQYEMSGLPITDTRDKILRSIPVGLQWDPITKQTINGKPVGWNLQKMAACAATMKMANINNKHCVVARYDTAFGMFQDEQSINADYKPFNSAGNMADSGVGTAMDALGGRWALVGQFPNDLNGNPQGVFLNRMAFGSVDSAGNVATTATNQYEISQEFMFDPMCLKIAKSAENPGLSIKIYYSDDFKETRFRATAYLGGACINPLGIVSLQNSANYTSIGAAGGDFPHLVRGTSDDDANRLGNIA